MNRLYVRDDLRACARTMCLQLLIGVALLPHCSAAAQSAPQAQRWTPAHIASDQYESSPTFSPDGRELYFMRSDRTFRRYRLMVSRCTDQGWSAPEPPTFAAPESVLEGDPFMTAEGKRLYFISARENDNPENLDIWYVEREGAGGWSAPKRMPEPVNLSGSELLPRVTSDGRIYFGSDRPGGFGQMDIYVAERDARGAWLVSNVGPPVSTPASEYEADVSRDGRTMIVVADRGDRSHLYRFERRADRWIEVGRIPARADVFQVGPLLSPSGDRVLFAQADAERSGEMFLLDLKPQVDPSWPPLCENARINGK